jgi:hypothetical protein
MIGDFSSPYDFQLKLPDWLIDAAMADRVAALRSDAFRSFLFIVLAAGVLYLWQIKKLKTNLLIATLGILILADLWAVDKRYLNNDNFVSKREATNPFPEMPVDKAILKDNDLYYRVLPLQNPFQDARASYYHKSLGGYSAAKLRRYQEIIDYHLIPEMQEMIKDLQAGQQPDSVFNNLSVINMLNARYVIYDLNSNPLRNNSTFGNAWFVNDYQIVKNADEEITTLKNINPNERATIDQRFSNFVNEKQFHKDPNGSIVLTEYEPNYLKYTAKASSDQLAVFSEIYYDEGWNAYIDGKKVPHFRVDYVLRALVLPAGEHTVEFKFHPKSYYTGDKVSLASSLLLLLAIAGYGIAAYRRKNQEETELSENNG